MKKRLFLVLSAVLVLSFMLVGTASAADPSWTGTPDPMACNQYHDCFWVTPVCIAGTTYDIGVYFNPDTAPVGQIEAQALYWSGTVLTAGACKFQGYTVPHVILYKGPELKNGFGVIVSTEYYASVENALDAFKLTAPLPEDVKPICQGPVVQMSPNDTQGKWACDALLVGILPNGNTGLRLPLISDTGPSLQKVYEGLLKSLK